MMPFADHFFRLTFLLFEGGHFVSPVLVGDGPAGLVTNVYESMSTMRLVKQIKRGVARL
jgi:hypothetical protein